MYSANLVQLRFFCRHFPTYALFNYLAYMSVDTNTHEMHPLFPSGDWEGFYSYYPGDKNPMQCSLSFHNSIITGSGSDQVGPFSWKGTYNKAALSCTMTKFYNSHTVLYQGDVDENGIQGSWEMEGGRGGFHLWPKAKDELHQAQQTEIGSMQQQQHTSAPDKIDVNLFVASEQVQYSFTSLVKGFCFYTQ